MGNRSELGTCKGGPLLSYLLVCPKSLFTVYVPTISTQAVYLQAITEFDL